MMRGLTTQTPHLWIEAAPGLVKPGNIISSRIAHILADAAECRLLMTWTFCRCNYFWLPRGDESTY
jgi:hypothetical protein